MLVASVVGIFHRVPDGQHVGVQMHIGLPSESRIPQISITLRIGTGGTADHLPVILGDKQSCVVAVLHLSEEGVVGNKALGLQDIMTTQKF